MATLKGRVLLGWMPKAAAIRFLKEDCHFAPPLDDASAEAIWLTYHQRVTALPARTFAVCGNLGLSVPEAHHAQRFSTFLQGQGQTEVIGVQKVDLRDLVVHQYHVVTERSQAYASGCQTPQSWLELILPTSRGQSQIQLRFQQNGLSSYAEIDIPHAEFIFAPNLSTGQFSAAELLRHVTMMDGTDRSFLWSGYHRSFARVSSTPTAAVPSAVVALARNVMTAPLPANAAPGVATIAGIDDLCPFGAKAARFGDFFTDGLFMDVDLRKKRYQLQVHANWTAVDAP